MGRCFVPGGSPIALHVDEFRGQYINVRPSPPCARGGDDRSLPELAIADPTIGWVNAAFRLMRRFEDIEYPRQILIPVLILAAGADRLVDTEAAELFASRLKASKCITLRNALHEILMESDDFRAQFWAAFDAFLPGGSASGEPGEALLPTLKIHQTNVL